MNLEIVMMGNSALLMHNPRMVDPEYSVNREIKALTGKRKKTSEDLRQIEFLEWHGGLYTGEIDGKAVVTQPTSKVRKCLINTARINKLGKQIERGVIMTQLDVPLIYPGCDKVTSLEDELKRLIADSAYSSRLSVGVGNKRVMRVRPQFLPWAMIVPVVFVPDAGLNFDDLERIVELSGIAERIGDNRVNGYGSFRGHVRQVTATTKPIRLTIDAVREFFASLDRLDEKGAA